MDNKINGRMPEEIKKGLECCFSPDGCEACPYHDRYKECLADKLKDDIVAYTQQLERERDAAVRDLGMFAWGRCAICVHCDADKRYEPCLNCGCCEGDDDNWQWRGVEVE